MRTLSKVIAAALTVVLAAPAEAGVTVAMHPILIAQHGAAPGWDRGHWVHGAHDGRNGWWWTVGPSWFWYENPTYPYPAYPYDPPDNAGYNNNGPDYAALAPSGLPQDEHWYYCENPRGYYPYVSECPGDDWRIVPIDPAIGIHRTAGEQQYYCLDPAGYYPMVADCKREWRIVPWIAPPR